MARGLHAAGLRQRRPEISLSEIQADWIESLIGSPCPVPIPEGLMEPVNQEFQPVFRFAVQTLDRLGIAYAVGGSVASSLYGVSRMTRDADLTVEPFPNRIAAFVTAFDPNEFYLSPEAVGIALKDRSTFNILHPSTGYKLDLFVRKDDPFEQSAFSRRTPFAVPGSPDERIQVHSPEDVILFKLRWYRIGNEVSDQQWRDILGVLHAQRGRLSAEYLDRWAAELGVKDLLNRARGEV